MRVNEIMSTDPVCCARETNLREVAELMVTNDCGEIPICDGERRPIGVVTDRDIVCRLVAKGHNPLEATAEDCMSDPVITTDPEMDLDDCARLMEQYQVRRVPVVDKKGVLCGIITQADLARRAPRVTMGEVMEKVSEPNTFASSVGGR